MPVNPIPEGYHSITPYLIVRDAASAIEFYSRAFAATEMFRLEADGKVGHAEMRIGNSVIMLADEDPEMGFKAPAPGTGNPVSLMVYVEDVNVTFPAAIAAGATEVRPLQDQFYGDRSGQLLDPFGHLWAVATHMEDVSPEEMTRRTEAMKGGQGA